jgi:hypothetical protein
MNVLAVIMAGGYTLLGVDLVVNANYMDSFVAFTISAVFAFGLFDIFSAKKRGAAHVLTGGILSMIFSAYFVIEYFANDFDFLINNGKWTWSGTLDFLGVLILGIGGVISFYLSKKVFKSAKIGTRR